MTSHLRNSLIILRNRLPIILPDLIVIACCLVSLGLSVIESRVTTDAHHWGLMYGNAADLHQGLVPYRETFIQYGWLTTLIQSFSLSIFGNTVVSLGIITGIFYAINIYLSYCLWQKILNKWLSSISAVLMFLSFNYINMPWANYFYYTFLLGSILFITSSPEKQHKYLLAGVFASLSFLARQSPLPILAPFYLYFLFIFFVSSRREFWQLHFKNIVAFHLGLIVVLGSFFIYLFQESALTDWQAQTLTIANLYKNMWGGIGVLSLGFFSNLILGKTTFTGSNLISTLYSLIFLNALIVWANLSLTARRKQINHRDKILFLFSSVILFGYLNVLHLYTIDKLQNSSSLGFGLLILSLDNLSNRFRQWKRLIFTIPVVCLFLYLSKSSIYSVPVIARWDRDVVLSNQLKEPENVGILKGKLYDEETRNHYEILAQTMTKYSSSCQLEYLVNLQADGYIPYLTKSLKKVQRSPFYSEVLEQAIFKGEKEKVAELLKQKKAILVASDYYHGGGQQETFKLIPKDYEVVLEVSLPNSIPFQANNLGKKVYIAVPKNLNCQN